MILQTVTSLLEYYNTNPWRTVGVLLCVFVATHYVYWKRFFTGRPNEPPSYYFFPVVGVVPLLLGRKMRTFVHDKIIAPYFPPIFRVYVPFSNVVIVKSAEALREAMANDPLSGKIKVPSMDFATNLFVDGPLFANESGPWWSEQRKFMITSLNKLGLGNRSIMEPRIKREIGHYLREIEKRNGQPMNIKEELLTVSLTSNMVELIMGRKPPRYDALTKTMVKAPERIFLSIETAVGLFSFFPKFILEAGEKRGFIPSIVKDEYDLGVRYRAFMTEYWEMRKRNFNPDKITDYMDYLVEEHLRQPEKYTVSVVRSQIMSIGIAGGHTLEVTMDSLYQHCGGYQNYQEQMFQEIKQVIGLDRLPNMEDYEQMHFTKAFVLEQYRILPLGPYGTIRSPTEDTTIQGLHIEEGSFMIYSVQAAHQDEKLWGENTHIFNPNRHLKNGKFVKSPNLLHFSPGKRGCPGEAFAHLSSFFYLVAVVQRFKILPQDDKTPVILAANEGQLFAETTPQKLRYVKRSECNIPLPEDEPEKAASGDQTAELAKKYFHDFRWTHG